MRNVHRMSPVWESILGRSIGFQCCFCGHPIAHREHDPVKLTLALDDEGVPRELYCHAECLRGTLHSPAWIDLDD